MIWNHITDILQGEFNPNKKLSYESSEFGTISQKGISETLLQVFGAKHSPNKREKRKLIFDLAKLERVGKLYDLALEVQVGDPGAHNADGADIGLDRHLTHPSTDIEIRKNNPTNQNYYDKVELNSNKDITKEKPINAFSLVDSPQAPHPPHGELLSPLDCSICLNNKNKINAYSEEQQKPENTIRHNYKSDGRLDYYEYLHLDAERKVTVCGVFIAIAISGGLEGMLFELKSKKGRKLRERIEVEQPIEQQQRKEFWKDKVLPASEITPNPYYRDHDTNPSGGTVG